MTIAPQPEPSRPVWSLALAAVALSVVMRLLPYSVRMPNLAPIGAFSLYAGARLPRWAALALPLATMGLSDYLLVCMKGSGYAGKYYVYACYGIMVLVGMLLRRSESVWKIGAAALSMNVMFFFVTNLAAWYEYRGREYEDSINGAVAALIAGIEFHRPTFFGDVLFVSLFFGIHAWAIRHQSAAASEESPA